MLNIYRDFFRICKDLVKKNGTITCIGLNIEKAKEIAELEGFKVKHEREVMQGKERLKLFVFK